MPDSQSRGIAIVPAAITIGVVAAMIVLIGQITLRPWAGTDSGFDTHLNYSTVGDDYTRSVVGRVGDGKEAPVGWTPVDEKHSALAAWAGYGCASCHGLDGYGGVVGPDLQELVRDDFAKKIRFGQDGMPAYGDEDLTDEHIVLLEEYLVEIGGPPPTPTPIPATPVPTSTPSPTVTPLPISTPAPTATVAAGVSSTQTPALEPTVTVTATVELTPTVESEDDELIAAGKLLYEETAGVKGCAECHGFNAEGGGPGSNNAPSIRGTTASKIRSSIDDAFDMNDIKLSSDELLALEAYLLLFVSEESGN